MLAVYGRLWGLYRDWFRRAIRGFGGPGLQESPENIERRIIAEIEPVTIMDEREFEEMMLSERDEEICQEKAIALERLKLEAAENFTVKFSGVDSENWRSIQLDMVMNHGLEQVGGIIYLVPNKCHFATLSAMDGLFHDSKSILWSHVAQVIERENSEADIFLQDGRKFLLMMPRWIKEKYNHRFSSLLE